MSRNTLPGTLSILIIFVKFTICFFEAKFFLINEQDIIHEVTQDISILKLDHFYCKYKIQHDPSFLFFFNYIINCSKA